MASVSLNAITKRFGDVEVLPALSLEVADREFVVLVGPSGCGKTTTLRIIAGLEPASSGQVMIGERDVSELRPGLRNCSMVFQNYALYPHMTVRENIAYGMKVRGEPKAVIAERVEAAARTLGLEPFLERRPGKLSGGQRQRVAIGRAIVRQPDVFLFDEPLSNLDAKLRIEMRAEIKNLHRHLQHTIVYVTHDQVEAMTLADRVVVMNQGRIEQIAAPLELYERPANRFVAGFIGAPSMNFLDGRVVRADGGLAVRLANEAVLALPASTEASVQPYIDRPVVLGIRPEHMAGGGEGEAVVSFRPKVIEPLGPHTMLIGELAGAAFTAQVDAHFAASLDVESPITLQMPNAHLFDPESGRSLL